MQILLWVGTSPRKAGQDIKKGHYHLLYPIGFTAWELSSNFGVFKCCLDNLSASLLELVCTVCIAGSFPRFICKLSLNTSMHCIRTFFVVLRYGYAMGLIV